MVTQAEVACAASGPICILLLTHSNWRVPERCVQMDVALVSWMDAQHTPIEAVDQLPETRSREREVAARQRHQRPIHAAQPLNMADVSPLVRAACAQPASAAGRRLMQQGRQASIQQQGQEMGSARRGQMLLAAEYSVLRVRRANYKQNIALHRVEQ